MAHDADDVAKLFAYGRRAQIPVTLRGGGTSLNGQGQTSGILVDVRRHFRGVTVLEDGGAVRVRPGTLLGTVNRALRKSAADRARPGVDGHRDGRRCGRQQQRRHALRHQARQLPDAAFADVRDRRRDDDRQAAPGAAERFAQAEPELRRASRASETRSAPTRSLPSASPASSRSRTRPGTGSARSSMPTSRWTSSRSSSSARRGRWRSSPTPSSTPSSTATTRAPACCSSTASRSAIAPVPAFVAAGATAVEVMVNATLVAASWALPGMPEAWRESCRPGGPSCSSSCARTTRRSSRAWRPRRTGAVRASSCSSPRSSRATRTPPRCSGPCARACRARSAAAPPARRC